MKNSSLKPKVAFIGAFLASALLLSACSGDEPVSTPVEQVSVSAKSDIRSVEEACDIAIAFLSADSDALQSRSVSDIDNVKVGYGTNSRNSTDTLFYSVNLSDNEGFVIVSAPKAAVPVLAYVEAGSYDPAETTDNPGFNLFIEKSKEYTTNASITIDTIDIKPYKKPYTVVREAKPRLKVEWGQSYPEGILCPNGLCGCDQTAMAQVFSYFEQPTSIELTYPGHDVDRVQLNWSEIKKHRVSCYNEFFSLRTHMENCNATQESHNALAYLCRELGHRNNAEYKDNNGFPETYTLTDAVYSLYKTLLPSKTFTPFTSFSATYFNRLISNMKTYGAVAIFRGSTDQDKGHSWICDGGKHYEYHTQAILLNGKEDIRNTYYFHFNWGECGDSNGYFLGDVYDPDQVLQEDEIPAPVNPTLPLSISRSGYSKDVHFYMIY